MKFVLDFAAPRRLRQFVGKEGVDKTFDTLFQFTLRKRPQRQDLHAAGQGFRKLRQEKGMGGPREQKSPRRAVRVDQPFDGDKKLRSALYFVQDHRPVEPGNKPERVRPRSCENSGIVECNVASRVLLSGQRLN